MLDNFTFEEWKTLFKRFRAESKNDSETIEKLSHYIPKLLSGCDWLDKKAISHERCEEINNMMIPCPWGGYKDVYKPYYIMDEKGRDYISSADENIVYTRAFMPKHDDIGHAGYEDTYLLIKGDKYYLFYYDFVHDDNYHKNELLGEKSVRAGSKFMKIFPPTKKKMPVRHYESLIEIKPNEKIDSSDEKDEILKIIKNCIIFRMNHWAFDVNEVTVKYKGKVIK